jgi:hypothetical protein
VSNGVSMETVKSPLFVAVTKQILMNTVTVTCKVCKPSRTLLSFVVTSFKTSVNLIFSLNLVSDH